MAKRRTTPDRPRDMNQLAYRIVAIATGEATDDVPTPTPKQVRAAQGGHARAESLTPAERVAIATKGARASAQKRSR